MQETPESGTDLTNKCSDTTAESTPNISDGTQRPSKKQGKPTSSRRRASGTNVSSAKHEPLPRYLPSDLSRLTFTVGGNKYQADDIEHTFLWMKFVTNYADVGSKVDWEDLEERAHFLNMLYEFCEGQGVPFPLDDPEAENFNERFNAR